MRGYVEVCAYSYSVEGCVAMVDGAESIAPTISADTERLSRKLSGMSTEQEDLR